VDDSYQPRYTPEQFEVDILEPSNAASFVCPKYVKGFENDRWCFGFGERRDDERVVRINGAYDLIRQLEDAHSDSD
jgi:hypothetical protein